MICDSNLDGSCMEEVFDEVAFVGFLVFGVFIPYRMPFLCQDIQRLVVVS